MARRTEEELKIWRKEQIRLKRIKRLNGLIQNNKFINDPKYYKNNWWSLAAHDSWAATGKVGSCGCGCGYYNGTLRNKRKNTDAGGKKSWLNEVSPNLCYDCIKILEELINHKFKRH